MQDINFQSLPPEYSDQKQNIQNPHLKEIYEEFQFDYLNHSLPVEDVENHDKAIKNFLNNFLKDFKFIVYNIFSQNQENQKEIQIVNNQPQTNNTTVVICVEERCIIIETNDSKFIYAVFQTLKSNIINVDKFELRTQTGSIETNETANIRDEVTKFSNFFKKEVRINHFVNLTLKTIGCFLIRRFFYPTTHFKDPSFFNFGKDSETYESNVKKKLRKMLLVSKISDLEPAGTNFSKETFSDNNDTPFQIHEFSEKEFIFLRIIHTKANLSLQMAFHIKSRYVFLIKKIDKYSNAEHTKEIEFCKNFHHSSFMRFYGFIKSGSNIEGFVYEYLCNGSLQTYVKKHKEEKDEMFSFVTIYRLCKGLEYLHSHSNIHRDIKPDNILLDHDFIPYISDFETIRHTKDENHPEEFTNDLGQSSYTSPEQIVGETLSYATDIYSLGLIIYYIYEKRCLIKCDDELKMLTKNKYQNIQQMTNGTDIIRFLYHSCVKYAPEDRITIDEIKNKLKDEYKSFYYLDKYYEQQLKHERLSIIIEYFYENINFLISTNKSNELENFEHIIYDFILFGFNIDLNNPCTSSLHKIGQIYELGECQGIKQNYSKSKYYYEESTKLENQDSYLSLGNLYYYGKGVPENPVKARELYEQLAKYNNPNAYSNLGELYYYGNGVTIDYAKAKKYFELSAQQNNSDGIFNMGVMYYDGRGVVRDIIKAKEFLERSARLNNPRSLNLLGNLCLNEMYEFYDPKQAIEYYKQSAELNNKFAFESLGNIYFDGKFVEQNIEKALEYYQKSFELGNPMAYMYIQNIKGIKISENDLKKISRSGSNSIQNQLIIEQNIDNNIELDAFTKGQLYYTGSIVRQDYTKAIHYYQIAAQQNHPVATLLLGHMHMNGERVHRNYFVAKEYYEKSLTIDDLSVLPRFYSGHDQNFSEIKETYKKEAKKSYELAILNIGISYFSGNDIEQNYNKAKEYFEILTKQEFFNSYGYLYLGIIYLNGKGQEKDFDKAKEYFEQAAKSNNSDAFRFLGHLYENGYGVKQNYSLAIEYYEKSTKYNNSIGLFELGKLYFFGDGVQQDYLIAKHYFKSADKHGSLDAKVVLGYYYYFGICCKQNYLKAMKYFVQPAQNNNDFAAFFLGLLYYNGYGVIKNYQEAKKYFKQSAQQNNSNALFYLGNLYVYGLGVEQNFEKAKEYYGLSAALNNSFALNNIGVFYLYGISVEKDYNKALEYLHRAANLNNLNALLNLGILYLNGNIVTKDEPRSRHYLNLLVQQSNDEALTILGYMHFYGIGVKKDYQKAKEYFERSAKNNDSYGFFYLGMIYQNGYGVDCDYSRAKRYYEFSSYLKNSQAIFSLGYLYENGLGVEQNFLKAKEYYEMAAERNNPTALFHLGTLYLNGDIFEVDITKAKKYFLQCSKIQNGLNFTQTYSKVMNNIYIYHSFNELGLIFLNEDNLEAENYIKKSAYSEYPFGQNIFGLYNQLYLGNKGNAIHMFERSSEHHFALAEYNLGYLQETEGKIQEAVEYYKKASDDEDAPLIFQNNEYFDKRLEISKTFILCFTNLKLANFYLSQQNYEHSKKYFIRSLSKLYSNKSNFNKFRFVFNKSFPKQSFSYLKKIILQFHLFNLSNIKISKQIKNNEAKSSIIKKDLTNELDTINDAKIGQLNCKKSKQIIFDDPDKLFEFICSNKEYTNIFVDEIQDIIQTMHEIIYTPPYSILFGRINIEKPKLKEITKINELFYEGLDLDDLQNIK